MFALGVTGLVGLVGTTIVGVVWVAGFVGVVGAVEVAAVFMGEPEIYYFGYWNFFGTSTVTTWF